MKFLKNILLALCFLMGMSAIASASDTYWVQVGDFKVEMTFDPGPCGPGDAGVVDVTVNGDVVAEYGYAQDFGSPVITVYGLGTFFQYDGELIFYKDLLGVPMLLETN